MDDSSSYCCGMRAGAHTVVKKYEKQCLEDTADECNDLGVAAAQGKTPWSSVLICISFENMLIEVMVLFFALQTEIAFEFCPFDIAASFAPDDQPDYKETCREVATGICKGNVGDQVNDNGCSISTSGLKELQAKCERQVNDMTGGSSAVDDGDADDDKWHGSGDDEFAGIIRTDNPTSTPTFVSECALSIVEQ